MDGRVCVCVQGGVLCGPGGCACGVRASRVCDDAHVCVWPLHGVCMPVLCVLQRVWHWLHAPHVCLCFLRSRVQGKCEGCAQAAPGGSALAEAAAAPL